MDRKTRAVIVTAFDKAFLDHHATRVALDVVTRNNGDKLFTYIMHGLKSKRTKHPCSSTFVS